MKRHCIAFIIIIACVELLFASGATANENFSGKWHVNAGTVRYTMDLTQRGHQVFGSMKAVNRNNSLLIMVYGTVNGRRVSLNAHNINFSIILQLKGVMMGQSSGRGLSGFMTINNRHKYKWHAVRY